MLQHSIALTVHRSFMPRISVKLLLALHKLCFSSLPIVATTGWQQHQVGDCALLCKTTQWSHEQSLCWTLAFMSLTSPKCVIFDIINLGSDAVTFHVMFH